MAYDNAFEEDDPLGGAGGSYSQLLFGDDDAVGLDTVGRFNFNSLQNNPSRMLCFGDYNCKETDDEVLLENAALRPAQDCGVTTCSDSSLPLSSTTNCSNNNKINNSLPKSNKKRSGSGGVGATAAGNQKNSKKARAANSTAKFRKAKLGDRITALQQLVSPFGKTDTASVLHEAMGYIRFLHDQVQVLCSPYLQRLPSSDDHIYEGIEEKGQGEANKDLRSRGLCLVPVELTSHVADANGADFWLPAKVNEGSSDQ